MSTTLCRGLSYRRYRYWPLGQSASAILLAQELAIILMLIIIGLLGAYNVDNVQLIEQGVGPLLAIALFSFIITCKQVHLPLSKWLKDERKLQLFTALGICFSLTMLTPWLELSTALGAFMATMLAGTGEETLWVHRRLDSFVVLFIALFFVSMGMLFDVGFLFEHWQQTALLVLAALVTNTFIHVVISNYLTITGRKAFMQKYYYRKSVSSVLCLPLLLFKQVLLMTKATN